MATDDTLSSKFDSSESVVLLEYMSLACGQILL